MNCQRRGEIWVEIWSFDPFLFIHFSSFTFIFLSYSWTYSPIMTGCSMTIKWNFKKFLELFTHLFFFLPKIKERQRLDIFTVLSMSVYRNKITQKSWEETHLRTGRFWFRSDCKYCNKLTLQNMYSLSPQPSQCFFSQWFLEWKRDDNALWASGESKVQYVPWQSRDMPRPSPIA